MVNTLNSKLFKYLGDKQPGLGEMDSSGRRLYPYLPDKGLIEAVNLSIFLERPLLLKGDPGSGKTRLAHAVAYELGLPFEAWYVKSTSRARDGLYVYDAVGRLRDVQLIASGRLASADIQRMDDPVTYVRLGALGRAFQKEQQTVVLIDEVDKADIDFPNDLLLELDERRFIIEETDQEISARFSPIVIITSNDEKELPDAFLRRCLFYYLEFPNHDRLMKVVKSHFPDSSDKLLEKSLVRFQELRKELRVEKGETGKQVSTSELLDWFRVLSEYSEDEALAMLDGRLPFVGVLLKSWEDHIRYLRSGS
jgi:MoxR-like ATPase